MTRQLGSLYELDEPIGSGAMGQVWRGRELSTGEPVAAKLLRPELTSEPELVARFVQERSILLALDHPNIVRVRDLVVDAGDLAIVMDLVEGSDLRAHLRGCGRLAPGEAVALTIQVLDALDAAHALVLHRDVKPDNVLLRRAPEGWTALLSDFGIARLADSAAVRMSQLIGTPDYLAPEVISDQTVTGAVDVYAVGVVLYELLAGRTPFGGKGNSYVIGRRHVDAAPPVLDGLDPRLWHVVAQLLRKDPASRPSASAAAALLRALLPSLAGMPALAPSAVPEQWERVEATPIAGAETQIRGDQLPVEEPAAQPVVTPAVHAPGNDGATGVQQRPVVRTEIAVDDEVPLETPGEAASRRRTALLAAGGIVLIGLVAAAVLYVRGPATEGKRSGPGAGATGAAAPHDDDTQKFPSDLLSVTREYSLEPGDDGTSTLVGTLTYRASTGAPIHGPVREAVPPPALQSTAFKPVWDGAGSPEPVLQDVAVGDRPVFWTIELPELSAQSDEPFTTTFRLDGIDLGDKTPAAFLADGLAAARTLLGERLESASARDPALWLQAVQGLSVRPDFSSVTMSATDKVPYTVEARLPSDVAPLARFEPRGRGEPTQLLEYLGGLDAVRVDAAPCREHETYYFLPDVQGPCHIEVTVAGVLKGEATVEVIRADTSGR